MALNWLYKWGAFLLSEKGTDELARVVAASIYKWTTSLQTTEDSKRQHLKKGLVTEFTDY